MHMLLPLKVELFVNAFRVSGRVVDTAVRIGEAT